MLKTSQRSASVSRTPAPSARPARGANGPVPATVPSVDQTPYPVAAPHTYTQMQTLLPTLAMANVTSLVFDGTFQRYPELRVVFTEYGVTWALPLLWRMDEKWRSLRVEMPWLEELPSVVARRHIRLTTQPLEVGEHPAELGQVLKLMHAEEMVMFATDYPHWDNDFPDFAFGVLPDSMVERISSGNALEVYPIDGITLGAVGYASAHNRTTTATTKDRIEGDLKIDLADFVLQAEYIHGWDGPTNVARRESAGAYAALGYTIAKKIQPLVRIGAYDANVRANLPGKPGDRGPTTTPLSAGNLNDEITSYEPA